ncbi:MAG TPA: rhodanese-like domain-containing protein [Nitrospiraceae bacterium]|nr:rhodanese-like domain-containing protein [Nitrospiraceae bacterium]
MKYRTMLMSLVATLAAGLLFGSGAVAYHSYILTVKQLRGGLEKASSPGSKGFVLIDVRSPEEHAAGVIPGTDMNIEFNEIKARHREIGAKLDDHIVVYCQSGHRSNIAAEALADLGYRHVYNVSGSMNAWVDAGYPVQPTSR